MSEITQITEELQSIHEGDAWHGPSLTQLLDGVSAAQAAARPLPAAHSIWELVRHITAWEGVFRSRLEGVAVEEPAEGDFPPVTKTSDAAWAQAITALHEEHARLLATAASLSEAQLNAKVINRPYSAHYLLRSAISHHVYHAGQIAILKKS